MDELRDTIHRKLIFHGENKKTNCTEFNIMAIALNAYTFPYAVCYWFYVHVCICQYIP